MAKYLLELDLTLIASGASEGKNEKNWRFGHTKIIGPRPLGGARAGCAPPPGSASAPAIVIGNSTHIFVLKTLIMSIIFQLVYTFASNVALLIFNHFNALHYNKKKYMFQYNFLNKTLYLQYIDTCIV